MSDQPIIIQIILAVLGSGLSGAVISKAVSTWFQARANVQVIQAESDKDARIKKLQIALEAAQGQREKSRSDEAQTDKIITSQNDLVVTLARTIERFDNFLGRLDNIEKLIEGFSQNIDDWHLEIATLIRQEAAQTRENSVEQRKALEKSRRQEFLTFANEFAGAFVTMQKAQRLDKNLFVFPSPGHPGWKYRYATPVYSKVTFFNAPWIDDGTPIPGVEIDGEGELVHVIENYVHGWHVVSKTKNGIDFPGIGYVPDYAVKLDEVKGGH